MQPIKVRLNTNPNQIGFVVDAINQFIKSGDELHLISRLGVVWRDLVSPAVQYYDPADLTALELVGDAEISSVDVLNSTEDEDEDEDEEAQEQPVEVITPEVIA